MAEETFIDSRLRVENLEASYGGSPSLRGIDLIVGQGETVAIVGRSGVGKSTFFRCASGLQDTSGGNAFLEGEQYIADGRMLVPAWKIRRRIGLVFQNYNLFPNMTALRNVTLGLEKVRGMRRPEAEALARQVASFLDISQVLERFPESLSGGQAQRIALLRALVLVPEVLFLDEVTSSVDPETSGQIVETIRKLRAAEAHVASAENAAKISIVLATHLFRFAESFADRIVFMSRGRIVEAHPAAEFRSKVTNEDAKRYLEFAT